MDEIEPAGQKEALDVLVDNSGQTYLTADRAIELLAAFTEQVTESFCADEVDFYEEGDPVDAEVCALALSEALATAQRPATDARGIVRAAPHTMILAYDDVSKILVKAIGGSPAASEDYAGAGFSADSRHETNVGYLKEQFGDYEPTA